MPPSLPVPSKAAIHALRGLALGTSCAVGVIVEERRRRINLLRTALENKKKLRSSKRYHGAAEALAAQMEDAHVLSADELRLHQLPDNRKSSGDWNCAAREAQAEALRSSDVNQDELELSATPVTPEDGQRQQSPNALSEESAPPPEEEAKRVSAIPDGIPLRKDNGGWTVTRMAPRKAKVERTLSDIMAWLENDEASIDTFIRQFIMDSEGNKISRILGKDWFELSLALSRYCMSKGRWKDAQAVLAAVVRCGPLEEHRFYLHDPIAIIESALPAPDAEHRVSGAKSLLLAVQLFLAAFKQKPQTHAAEIQHLGETLISLLFTFNQPKRVHDVYWRVMAQTEAPTAFTARFISALFEYNDDKSVLKYFRLTFSKMNPDEECFNRIFELVVQVVESMKGAQVHQILRALAKMCDAADRSLKSEWLTRLLRAHWSRFEDIARTKEVLQEMVSLRLLNRVDHPEYIYSVMAQLSVFAGDSTSVRTFYDEAIFMSPKMANNIGHIGLLALEKAKAGDWEGVRSVFVTMQPQREAQQRSYDNAFVAILKIFSQDHSVSEIEDFIRYYSGEMHVGMQRYLVTLVAKQYGEARDLDGFLQWLEFCSSRGYALDSSFCNAVLYNCRKRWNFPFRMLRGLFTRMRKLSPNCVDAVTRRIMHNAAVMGGRYSGRSVRRRIWSMSLTMSRLPYWAKSANKRDIFEVMNEELISGRPARAMFIYKRALRFGMPWCPHCFRIAVKAVLKGRGNRLGEAINLISDTHQLGHDITSAAAVLIKSYIDQFRGTIDDIMTNVQSVITLFESKGILIETTVLTHIAIVCVQSGRHAKAITLCKLAMERSGATNPCFSWQCLRGLLMAYWQTFDVEGVRWVVQQSLPSSPFATHERALKLLRETRRHLRKYRSSPRIDALIQLLEDGIDGVKRRRAALRGQSALIYDVALRIVGDAAAEVEKQRSREQEQQQKSWDGVGGSGGLGMEADREKRGAEWVAGL